MAVNTGVNVANGIISAIVLACGIIMSILIDQFFKKIADIITFGLSSSGISYNSYNSFGGLAFWAVGFAFIVPGLIGVIASFARQKCGFITQMVFAIITLVVMGIVFIVALQSLSVLSLYGNTNCHDVLGQCVCSNGYRATVPFGSSCNDINTLSSMAIGSTVMVVIGWIGCLAASITGGMLACARETTPGVVMHQAHQPGFTMVQMGNMQGAAQPYVIQPGYGGQQYPYVSPGSTASPSYYTGSAVGSNYAPSNYSHEELDYKK